MKYAKLMSGAVYAYEVTTAGEFLQRLSQQTRIPTWALKIYYPDGELKADDLLIDDVVYYLFVKPGYRLLDWIEIDQLDPVTLAKNCYAVSLIEAALSDRNLMPRLQPQHAFWLNLSSNAAAISLIEEYIEQIDDWMFLSLNPAAVHLLEQKREKIAWPMFATNTSPRAIEIMEQMMTQNADPALLRFVCMNTAVDEMRLEEILRAYPECWSAASSNPAAIHLLEQNQENIDWRRLSTNPAAIHLVEQNQEKIDWCYLSTNPAAIHLLKQNQEKIDWCYLSVNPAAIELLKQNQEKIDWSNLSSNPAAIELLYENQDKINWSKLSSNPSIFLSY